MSSRCAEPLIGRFDLEAHLCAAGLTSTDVAALRTRLLDGSPTAPPLDDGRPR